MKRAIGLYHRLPAPFLDVAASLRGWQLYRRRYGADTDRLVSEAHERERWTHDRWRRWQHERLAFVLRRAVEQVPYYREYWENKGTAWKELANWPVLDKEEVRRNPHAFLADDCDPRRLIPVYTSGSTGKPLFTWWSRETTRRWYALFEARWRMWHGVSRHDRWAILGGQLVVPVSRERPPFWVHNAPMKQIYLSAFHLRSDWLPQYLEAMEEYGVQFMWGYPSAMYQLAAAANELGRTLPLKVVLANAEPLYPEHRAAIEQAFQCPVRETYGMAEIVAGAGECEAGTLHQFPEAGIVELLDGDSEAAPGAAGDVVATGLFNPDMPLIRYRVGDRAVRRESGACPCGRTLPAFAAVEGRTDDLVVTPDGRTIGRLDVVFKNGIPIREAQVIQEELDRLVVRFVPGAGFTSAHAVQLQARFREYVGSMRVDLEHMTTIPRESTGKFRGVISKVAKQHRK